MSVDEGEALDDILGDHIFQPAEEELAQSAPTVDNFRTMVSILGPGRWYKT